MKRNIIVLGIGRFGQAVATKLFEKGAYVTAVDADYSKIEKIANYVSTAIQADITEEDAMKSLGISNYDVAIIATGADLEASIEATLICKDSGVGEVIAKATSSSHARILEKIGADFTVFPEQDMGARLARSIADPNRIELLDFSNNISVIEIPVKDKWVNHSLSELEFRNKFQMNVVGFLRNGQILMDINSDTPIEKDDILILIGSKENARHIEKSI